MTRRSKTFSMNLEEVLGKLGHNDQIDGLMVIGSGARSELTLSSDYDLVILLSDMPVPIDIGQTYIDHRPTDLNFINVDQVDRFLVTEEPINPYTTNGRSLLRMGDGKIELDRSNRLKRAREKVQGGAEVKRAFAPGYLETMTDWDPGESQLCRIECMKQTAVHTKPRPGAVDSESPLLE